MKSRGRIPWSLLPGAARALGAATVYMLLCLIVAAGAASAQVGGETYREPNGRFTVPIPPGWRMEEGQDAVMLTRGSLYSNVMILDSAGSAPAEFVEQLGTQVAKTWSGFQVIKREAATLGGQRAALGFFSGVNPKGIPSFFKVLAAVAGDKAYVLLQSAPQSEFPAAKATFEQIERGFSFGGGPSTGGAAAPSGGDTADHLAALEQAYKAGILTRDEYEAKKRALGGSAPPAGRTPNNDRPAPSGNIYRDPQGRFSLRVPAGWQSAPGGNGGVKISRGAAYCNVVPMGPATAAPGIVQGLIRQIAPQWQNFSEINHGDFTVGGAPAAYATFSGTNPAGAQALLRVVGVSTARESFALIMSGPVTENLKPSFDQIEESLSFGGRTN